MGLASNATGRLHTPALKRLQEVISQQNGRKCSSFPYNIRVHCPADWSSDGYKTTAGPRLHPLCTTPKVLITMTSMQEMATTTSYKNMQSTSLPPRYIPSHKSKVKLEVGPGAPPDFKFTNNISILSNHQDPPERPRRRCAGVLSLQVLWTSPWLDGFQQGEVEEFAA